MDADAAPVPRRGLVAAALRQWILPRLARPRELAALALGILATARRQGVDGLQRHLAAGRTPSTFDYEYRRWIALHDTLEEGDRAAIRRRAEAFARRPLISVLLPVHDPPPELLGRAVDSVRRQLYPDWELCVADDASNDPRVRAVLEERAAADPRIRVVFRSRRGHISEATNSALEIARGEFVALLDHDDELAETALYLVAEELERHPDADFLYSDHDKIDRRGRRSRPYFKPDWNPELLRGQNFAAHLAVFRTSRVRELGGLRPGLEGAQDHDLILRLTETTPETRIRHLPFVLYHWRSIPASTAASPAAKPYAAAAARRAVRDHLERSGGGGAVVPAALGQFVRVVPPLPEPPPRITMVWIARRSRPAAADALGELLRATAYRPLEVIALVHPTETGLLPGEIDGVPVEQRIWRRGASRSAALNRAAAGTGGDLLALVDGRLVPESAGWLGELARHALRAEIGAAGAKLLGSGGRVLEAGLLLHPDLVAVPACAGLSREAPGYFGRARLLGNVSAVSSRCLALRRSVFAEVGGLDERSAPERFAGVDLCLRLRERGYRVVWSPEALLRLTDGGDWDEQPGAAEIARLRSRWGDRLARDPCYSRNLSLEPGLDFRLAFPPAVERPWTSGSGGDRLRPAGAQSR